MSGDLSTWEVFAKATGMQVHQSSESPDYLLCCRASAAIRALPENERVAFVEALEARAAEWRGRRSRPTVWPMIVRVEQDPSVQAEPY